MGKISVSDFSAGWKPSDDFIKGRPNALLRMSNCSLDNMGTVRMRPAPSNNIGGYNTISSFGYGLVTYFSCLTKDSAGFVYKQRYVQLATSPGNILRCKTVQTDSGPQTIDFYTNIGVTITPNTAPVCFSSGFGQVFIGGNVYQKDDGSNTRNWGIAAPTAGPLYNVNSGATCIWIIASAYGGLGAVTGTISYTSTGITSIRTNNPGSGQLCVAIMQIITSTALDLLNGFSDGGTGTDGDTFQCAIAVPDLTQILSVSVEAILNQTVYPGGSNPTDSVTDYYFHTWGASDLANYYRTGNCILNCLRSDFQRAGSTAGLDWSQVHGIRFVFQSITQQTYTVFNQVPLGWVGGSNNQLYSGVDVTANPYEYAQRNAYVNGEYVGLSVLSPASSQVTVINGSVVLTPYTTGQDSQVNQYWFYKRGGTIDQWYLLGTCEIGQTYLDYLPDATIIADNQTYINTLEPLSLINEAIIDIVGPINGRFLLMTPTYIYFTDTLNPECIDAALTLKLVQGVTDQNLFMVKTTNQVVIAATTQELFEITGDFALQSDGVTYGINVSHLGVNFPPVTNAKCVADNILYYQAKDGFRALRGSQSVLLSGDIIPYFRNETKYGISPVKNTGFNLSRSCIATGKQKILVLCETIINNYQVFEYDLITETWSDRVFPTGKEVLYFFQDEDGLVISVHNDNFFRFYESGSSYAFDGSNLSLQTVNIQFACKDGGEPSTRKDLETLTLRMNLGGSASTLFISLVAEDQTTQVFTSLVGSTTNFNEFYITPHATAVDGHKRFALNLLITSPFFQLTDWELSYVSRAEPQVYSKALPNNLGSTGRKRIFQYACIVDTKGVQVQINLWIDNVLNTSKKFTSNGKTTFTFAFEAETIGIDFWHEIIALTVGSPFEDYGISLDDCISEKMPPLVNYLVLTPTNFKTPSKKRIRTIPLTINTLGNNVQFVPVVDNVALTQFTQTFNTTYKATVWFYFSTDVFGVDYGGILSTNNTIYNSVAGDEQIIDLSGNVQGLFEFYEMGTPAEVFELPDPKVYDQIGPWVFDRVGKILAFRTRLIATSTYLNWNLIADDVSIANGTITTAPNIDTTYQMPRLPLSTMGNVVRLELSSPAVNLPFYRFNAELKAVTSGMQTDGKWVQGK